MTTDTVKNAKMTTKSVVDFVFFETLTTEKSATGCSYYPCKQNPSSFVDFDIEVSRMSFAHQHLRAHCALDLILYSRCQSPLVSERKPFVELQSDCTLNQNGW